MTTLTLAEAIAAIDTAMKTHDPTVLEDLEILTSDGRTVPLRGISWDQIQAEIDADRAILEAQHALIEADADLLPELEDFFGDLAPQALRMLQAAVYDAWPDGADLPLIPHPSGVGTAVEPSYVTAEWRDMDDHERRLLRGRIDLEHRVGAEYWADLAMGALRGMLRSSTDELPLPDDITEDERLVVALCAWDELLTPESRDWLAALWLEAVRTVEEGQ